MCTELEKETPIHSTELGIHTQTPPGEKNTRKKQQEKNKKKRRHTLGPRIARSHIGQHPNIVQLIDVFPIEGAEGKMIVMELAQDPSDGLLGQHLASTNLVSCKMVKHHDLQSTTSCENRGCQLKPLLPVKDWGLTQDPKAMQEGGETTTPKPLPPLKNETCTLYCSSGYM